MVLRKRRVSRPLGAVVLLVLALGGLAACGDDDGSGDSGSGSSASGSPDPDASSDDGGDSPDPDRTHEPQPVDPDGAACTYTAGGPASKPVDPPADTAAYSGSVAVTLETSIGDLGATLDASRAPCTVNSFTSLASQGYYDGTTCHRLTTEGIFVLQCGDPTATGSGGPGYAFADELGGDETYPAGTIAMANAGPGTNGSQFFLVYADTPLPPSYTVFGALDQASIKTVADLAAQGTADGGPDGTPKTPVDLEFVEVGEAGDAPAADPTSDPATPAGTCDYPANDGDTGGKSVDAPPSEPRYSGSVRVDISTGVGRIPVTLDGATAPCTVGSFVSLAQQRFFDGTSCHRLTTEGIRVLQCGDPTGTGRGGPGYSFADELSGSETYPAGTLAMANAGADTNGSQFFIVYGDSPLPPSYTVFGTVSAAGLKVVSAVARAGVEGGATDGAPRRAVELTRVRVVR